MFVWVVGCFFSLPVLEIESVATGAFMISAKGKVVQNETDEFRVIGERHDIAQCILKDVRSKYEKKLEIYFDRACKVQNIALISVN